MGALSGRRILVTRTREQSSTLVFALRALGAEVIEVPTIRFEPPASYAPLDAALARLGEYDVLLVTSANTARVLAERRPLPWSAQPYTVAVGPATAEALEAPGLRVDLKPEPSVAESVLRILAPGAAGKKMLLVRAEQARDVLPDGLRAAGATVGRGQCVSHRDGCGSGPRVAGVVYAGSTESRRGDIYEFIDGAELLFTAGC